MEEPRGGALVAVATAGLTPPEGAPAGPVTANRVSIPSVPSRAVGAGLEVALFLVIALGVFLVEYFVEGPLRAFGPSNFWIAFVLLVPDLTSYLPSSVLAAVVIVAVSTLVDVRTFFSLLRTDLLDAALSAVAFFGVVFFGVLQGIVVAIVLSLVAFVHQAWRPYRTVLGRRPGVRGYHDLSRHPEGEADHGKCDNGQSPHHNVS